MARKLEIKPFAERSFEVPVTVSGTPLTDYALSHNAVEVSKYERARLYLDETRDSLDDLMEAKHEKRN